MYPEPELVATWGRVVVQGIGYASIKFSSFLRPECFTFYWVAEFWGMEPIMSFWVVPETARKE